MAAPFSARRRASSGSFFSGSYAFAIVNGMDSIASPAVARRIVLVTGATGYVGGRLVRALEARGERVRCVARRPEYLRGRVAAATEVVPGDVQDRASIERAMAGVDCAYYLVHSMGSSAAFAREDRAGAANFAAAAKAAGVRRIIYLGGLGDSGGELSEHLASRHEVGEVLRGAGVPVIEFRASIVIGSGSLSFEMVRALAERLPLMVTPRWVSIAAQPISIGEVIEYLIGGLDHEFAHSRIFEIGGADVVSYGDILREYARQRGLRCLMIPVPVLTPRLSSLWLALVTPLYARVGRKLIDSITHPTVVREPGAAEIFGVRPLSMRAAIERALHNEDLEFAMTRWSDPISAAGGQRDFGGVRFGNRLVDSRSLTVPVAPPAAFAPIARIGGRTGWYYAQWLWQIRGWLDLLIGGVGMRRGRRDPLQIAIGDPIDCWRVEAFEPDRKLTLRAEMKLPGRAWLDFEVAGEATRSTIRQTAIFDPIGLPGLAYWYGVWPLHKIVFAGMLRGIAHAVVSGPDAAPRVTPPMRAAVP
jgi:uncharacterized protein YbjT (DUF2867 family)